MAFAHRTSSTWRSAYRALRQATVGRSACGHSRQPCKAAKLSKMSSTILHHGHSLSILNLVDQSGQAGRRQDIKCLSLKLISPPMPLCLPPHACAACPPLRGSSKNCPSAGGGHSPVPLVLHPIWTDTCCPNTIPGNVPFVR